MSDLFSIANARQKLTQKEQIAASMARAGNAVGAKDVQILSAEGEYREGRINTLNKTTPDKVAPVDTKYFFTVPPTMLYEGDTVVGYNEWQWLVLNAQSTGDVVSHTTCGKLFPLLFEDSSVLQGFVSTVQSVNDEDEVVSLPKGQVKVLASKNEFSMAEIQQDAVFRFNGYGYKIIGRPNTYSSNTLVSFIAEEFQTEHIPTHPPQPEVDNFELGWPKTFTSTEPTVWTVTTNLKYNITTQDDYTLTITIPVQRNAVGEQIVVSNHLHTYNLIVE